MTNKQADLVIDLVHVREKVKQFIKENITDKKKKPSTSPCR